MQRNPRVAKCERYFYRYLVFPDDRGEEKYLRIR